ncbi:hypothetical protein R5W24_003985 [Gemmata sp. JC717]|uniref:DUF805 domain-containing protein n=1 Tax=Gemmata algarum TaxID=2975278 RepID=A0ABU5EXH2_9BACT|nr:hypothetical protein [Gemmata algarum]MDY3554855.1 hypothetical protein [Gemmata algarum]MDY3559975.1 hypothetical protein [Gemmata algarum]
MSRYARSQVSGPAMGLLVTAAISVTALIVALIIDVVILATFRLEPQQKTQITIRTTWAALMLVANFVIINGALRMKQLESHPLALTACILGMIPCLGPCFVLGLPFGIWGLTVLNESRVRRAFR